MAFPVAAAIGAAGSILGGLLGSHSAKKAAQYQAQLQRENWIYEQSNAHQLEVQDLKAAGLNPILSATGGQMAGNMSVGVQDPANWSGVMTSAVKAALEGQHLDNELKRIQIERDSANARIAESGARVKVLENESVVSAWKAHQTKAQTELLQRELWERIDLYELKYNLMDANLKQTEATINKLGAEVYELGSRAGLNYMKTQLLAKEYMLGGLLAHVMPGDFIDKFRNDPNGTLKEYSSMIGSILTTGTKDIGIGQQNLGRSLWETIKDRLEDFEFDYRDWKEVQK